jgi:hypothetical protein
MASTGASAGRGVGLGVALGRGLAGGAVATGEDPAGDAAAGGESDAGAVTAAVAEATVTMGTVGPARGPESSPAQAASRRVEKAISRDRRSDVGFMGLSAGRRGRA